MDSIADLCRIDEYYEGSFSAPTYDAIAARIGTVLVAQSCGSYQGDLVLLLAKGYQYGFVVQGYGSCSGCDALEGARSVADVQVIADRMEGSVEWGTATELAAKLRGYVTKPGDQESVRWYYYDNAVKNAITGKVLPVLDNHVK